MQPVFRFAPSPNGELHLGHALSALLNHQAAQAMGGRFLVRIEDVDGTRARADHVAGILEDLCWLGLSFEPEIRYQSAHLADYEAALRKLDELGLVYTSFASRKEIQAEIGRHAGWPRDPDGAPLFPPFERALPGEEVETRLARGDLHARRLNMDRALALVPEVSGPGLFWQESADPGFGALRAVRAEPQVWGDILLSRKDAPASYTLAVVVDDAAQGVSHVVRGQDLFHASATQRLLQQLLGLPVPLYHHHRLIVDGAGRKLSKSLKSTSLKALRAEGMTAEAVRQMVAT